MDTNENDNNQQNAMGSAKWWDSLSTMTEAKIALQYLFEKAAENMATLSNSKTQNKVGRSFFFFFLILGRYHVQLTLLNWDNESVLVLNKKLKFPIHFQFFI